MLEKPPRLRRSGSPCPKRKNKLAIYEMTCARGYVLANDWNIDPSDLVRQFMPE
jgi:hypothetical protein